MSDQEPTAPAPSQSASDERSQPPRANQPERGGQRDRDRDRGRRRHPQPNQPPPQQRRPEPALNLDELRELVELIAQHGFTDFELEREGIRVRLRRELAAPVAAPVTAPPAPIPAPTQFAPVAPSPAVTEPSSAPSAAAAAPASVDAPKAVVPDEELHIIPSPIVGTFYRTPSPTAEPFVRLGSHVSPDSVVCIIEAMKLMNEIQAEISGEVAKIYVENGQPVEYGQPLFGIKK